MQFKKLTYRIGDHVFNPRDIIAVQADGVSFVLTYVEVVSDTVFYEMTIKCLTDDVEVIVDGA